MAEFDQIFAIDPNNSQSVAENGVVSIYAPGTRNLLSLRTVTGGPLSNPLRVNFRGIGPAFMVDGYTEVAWEAVAPGEVFSGTFKSYKGVLEEALAAKASAREAVTAVPLKIQEALESGDFRGPAGAVSSLTIGTVSAGSAASATLTGGAGEQVLNLVFPSSAESHNAAPSYANAPAGSTFTIVKTANGWPNRYSSRADLIFIWQGAEPSPPIVATGTAGMRENDVRVVRGPVGA